MFLYNLHLGKCDLFLRVESAVPNARDLSDSHSKRLAADLSIHMQRVHTCAYAPLHNSRHCPVWPVTKATTTFLKQSLAPVKDSIPHFLIGYNTNCMYPTPLPSAHYCSVAILYSNIL